ncbi:MAG TPA: hypothetical protein VM536_08340, partial [Chloroflexia bacterium]|nr:hypothetical protein [Chloroflexia bacterium]
ERARFEWHPGNAAPYTVLLGRLGSETAPRLAATPTASIQSGIAGQVFIGPVCGGPDTGDPRCANQPYQTTLTVLSPARASIAIIATDAAGHFQIALPAGSYILVPRSMRPWPRAAEQSVSVAPGQVTRVTITYDSGIR